MSEFLWSTWAGFLIGMLIGLISAGFIGIATESYEWQKETVERGLANYCPNNGQWAWIGECDE